MDALTVARLQFAITTVYHFFFVPLTMGLAVLVAIMETIYVRTGKESYKEMTKFWGHLLIINFAMGVVTGIVQEFQFGMNWSEYSRFVGDIFGVPLAIEALMAFFLESTFLGIWIFGWDKLPKRVHAATIWAVAIGSNLSALWILIANSFMQQPTGFVINNGRAELVDFGALLTNPSVWVQYPHVLVGSLVTAAFFIMSVSGYHLLRHRTKAYPENKLEQYRRAFQIAAVVAVISGGLVILTGHDQAQHMVLTQPMKMASAEGLWETEDPASFSLFTIGSQENLEDVFSIRLPALLSVLAYNRPTGAVQGIRNLQAEYQEIYGPGNYVPNLPIIYWMFRVMVGTGFLMMGVGMWALYLHAKGKLEESMKFLKWVPLMVIVPYIANSAGWIMSEAGRQPWIVFGLMKTADAVSPTVTIASVWFSLIVYTLLYGALMAADIYLLFRYGTSSGDATGMPEPTPSEDELSVVYSGD